MSVPILFADRPAFLAYINATPPLISLLYDLGLMPEQVEDGSDEWEKLYLIVTHWKMHADAQSPLAIDTNHRTGVDPEEHKNDVLEFAARICETAARDLWQMSGKTKADAATYCAERIRSRITDQRPSTVARQRTGSTEAAGGNAAEGTSVTTPREGFPEFSPATDSNDRTTVRTCPIHEVKP